MAIVLRKAVRTDCEIIHSIQVKAFQQLLDKYQDFDTNPAAESVERIIERFEQEFTDYYLILDQNEPIGMLRVCDFGEACRLSPICILPENQGRGFAKHAMQLAEDLYPNAKKWTLDTIQQEECLCRLYEKMGYLPTGKYQRIKDGMNLVYYEKTL